MGKNIKVMLWSLILIGTYIRLFVAKDFRVCCFEIILSLIYFVLLCYIFVKQSVRKNVGYFLFLIYYICSPLYLIIYYSQQNIYNQVSVIKYDYEISLFEGAILWILIILLFVKVIKFILREREHRSAC